MAYLVQVCRLFGCLFVERLVACLVALMCFFVRLIVVLVLWIGWLVDLLFPCLIRRVCVCLLVRWFACSDD